MFRTGSKHFLGLTALTGVSFLVLLFTVDQLALAGVALSMLVAVLALLAWFTASTGDGDVSPSEAARATTGAAAAPWPALTAAGVVLAAVSLVTNAVLVLGGLVVVLAGLAEWMVLAWSERSSADPEYNRGARGRLLHPIEFPVAAALGLGVLIFLFSRIMLAIDKTTGALLFVVFGALILAAGSLFALGRGPRRAVSAAIVAAGAVGLLAGGVAGGTSGLRADLEEARDEGHYLHPECGPEKSTYFDKHAERTVSLRASVAAIVEMREGALTAHLTGLQDRPQSSLTIARSNPTTIIFRNEDDADRRLVANLGVKTFEDGSTEIIQDCTQLIEPGAEQALTLTIRKPAPADAPYTLTIAGVEGQAITVVVP